MATNRKARGRTTLERSLDTICDSTGESGYQWTDFGRRIFLRWAYAGNPEIVLRDTFLPDGPSEQHMGGNEDAESGNRTGD